MATPADVKMLSKNLKIQAEIILDIMSSNGELRNQVGWDF